MENSFFDVTNRLLLALSCVSATEQLLIQKNAIAEDKNKYSNKFVFTRKNKLDHLSWKTWQSFLNQCCKIIGDLESLKLDEEVEWKQNDGSSIYVKCTLCTNEGKYTINLKSIFKLCLRYNSTTNPETTNPNSHNCFSILTN